LGKKVSAERRILILSDTTEAAKSLTLGERANTLVSELPNAVIVLAGRPYDKMLEKYHTLPRIFDGWIVHDVHNLSAFSSVQTCQYMRELIPGIDPNLEQKIHILTAGNPVLISISAEWLNRHVDLPSEVDLPLEELRELSPQSPQLLQLRRDFEANLVDKVRTLDKPIDWALLYLSYLDRRYDPQILKLTLGVDENELAEILSELQKLAFVRKSTLSDEGGIHDEAKRLIAEHAWSSADLDGSMRRDLAVKVIEGYYFPEIDRLSREVRAVTEQAVQLSEVTSDPLAAPPILSQEIAKQTLQIECLDYHLRVSQEWGLSYLDQLLDEALESRSHIFLEALTEAVYNLGSSDPEAVAFQVRSAEMLWRLKQRDRALRLAQDILNYPNIQSIEEARALNILGLAASDPEEKVSQFRTALIKARAAGDTKQQVTFLRNLGLIHRQLGEWEKAEAEYYQALKLLDPHTEPDMYAGIMNNLAYVVMLRGNPAHAETLAEKALRLRKDTSNRAGFAFIYFTKGRIADAAGDYAMALRHYQTALSWFQSISDEESMAWVKVDIAQAKRRANDFDAARELLTPAQQSGRQDIKAEALAQAAKIDLDEAEALSLYAPSERDRITELYKSASGYAQQAQKLAEEIGDRRLQAVALFDLALIAWLAEKCEAHSLLADLDKLLDKHAFPLEQAHLIELRGTFAYERGETIVAFRQYITACRLLAEYSVGRFRRVFDRVRGRFFDARPEIQSKICEYLTSELENIPPSSPLIAFKSLCGTAFENRWQEILYED
jgi:tetratricopeptide (TPR) repeat protein